MPSVEFVRLASQGEHVCVQLELVQLELTANRISRDHGDADLLCFLLLLARLLAILFSRTTLRAMKRRRKNGAVCGHA